MAYPEITIVNCTTNEVVVREMTKQENEQLVKDAQETETRRNALANGATAKAALLDKLGITANEAALLLG
jgi:hypothetical protein